ncbi:MAG: efflux RND transporter permease subunit, partial [Alphaproteobacteria bacterium]|nr:efflux RND transporter permease subunit [Alphaproteobacteria bacterium]
IPEPLIVGRGINDVAVVVLTLTPRPGPSAERWTNAALFQVADELQAELIKVDEVGFNYLIGGQPDQIRVEPDPERMALYGITLNQLVDKVENANRSFIVGALRQDDQQITTLAGQTLRGIPDIGLLFLTSSDGRPVYVKDVADVVVGAKPTDRRAWHIDRGGDGHLEAMPAVSLALAKRQGANAVTVASDVLDRLEQVRGRIVPDGIDVHVVRNYGETAADKANELLKHLVSATITIVLLITMFVGWREGVVVLMVIPATILLTFFTAWLLGYTVNRVSMFALIFSIGILVDDAIVVVENVDRHWRMADGRSRLQAAIDAVAEVGNPTLIATITIIAALLPMMFVSGLMGPYMSPIPANASMAMIFSYLIAVTVTPWLMTRLRPAAAGGANQQTGEAGEERIGAFGRVYLWMARPLLKSRFRAAVFLLVVALATMVAFTLFLTKDVTVKLLPFDNKSELQVVVDLPEGSSLEATERVLFAAAERLLVWPEVEHIQAYAGTSAPFTFNGLVRHYYLRGQPEQGDLQINLPPRHERDRSSHAIALDVRETLAELDLPDGTVLKVAEIPPGPPVLATLLAEVYGPDAEERRRTAEEIRDAFEAVDFIVDVDDSFGRPTERLRVEIDQENLEFYQVEQEALYDTIAALIGGVPVGYSHRGEQINPIEIAIQMPTSDLFLSERLLATPVPGRRGVVELGDLVKLTRETASYPLFRHNGRFAEMVTGELAGRFEAPIYGMLAVEDALAAKSADIELRYHGQPMDESVSTLLWDGEWEVTYVTFRDMGAAFGVALVAIYLLLVGQFRRFTTPVLILTPVPLTLLGIVLGHWLLGAHFTATSMIGFIALAGIVVRNSILLVDFIKARLAED